jgi:hypothetical protein
MAAIDPSRVHSSTIVRASLDGIIESVQKVVTVDATGILPGVAEFEEPVSLSSGDVLEIRWWHSAEAGGHY